MTNPTHAPFPPHSSALYPATLDVWYSHKMQKLGASAMQGQGVGGGKLSSQGGNFGLLSGDRGREEKMKRKGGIMEAH